LATKFQILVESAANQPYILQKTIASTVNITTQAVSAYIKEMVKDGWIRTNGRSNNNVTKEGVNWLLKAVREMRVYIDRVDGVTRNMSICATVAGCNILKGQQVGLEMRSGLLIATGYNGHSAKGIAVTDARTGEDVGISSIEGIVELETSKIVILSIPGIQKGGSRKVDLKRLKKAIDDNSVTCAIGIESIIALRQIGIQPQYTHGVREVAAEAAQCGLSVIIVCVSGELPTLVRSLDDRHIEYQILDMEYLG
jgi:putative transcriptional regulator